MKGPKRGEHYDLYVVLDIFSRYVVAWCVTPTEPKELAKELIADAVLRHQVPPGQLTVHADRKSSVTSNPVTELLTFLGIGRSHSRPHVGNDNPCSESQFKTLKYCPTFPERFGSIQDAGRPASSSPPTTATSTVIRASAITRRRPCTTAPPPRFGPSGQRPSRSPTRPTPPGPATAAPSRRSFPPSPGPTSPSPQRRLRRRCRKKVSQIA
ncbi:MAG: DDE-type integrase/transposase/recombinase [Acidimicrobiales bacterium]